jgi:hemolysin activation/secretion protein
MQHADHPRGLMKTSLCIHFIGVVLFMQGLLSSAFAQSGQAAAGAGNLVEKVRPPVPQNAPQASPPDSGAAPQKPAAKTNDEGDPKPLGVNLHGLQLISKKTKPLPKNMRGVLVVDPALHLPAHLAEDLEREFLGQPVSMLLLNRMVKKINKAYQTTDFPLVDAYLPEQDISSGQVQIMVREALLGAVRVEGAKHSSPDYMRRQVRVQPGARIDTTMISKDVAWLNENPIRNVNVIYERGSKEGTSDVVLKTKENRPVQVYAGYANSGLAATGLNEVSTGFNWYQVLGTEQSLSYQFSGNQELDKLKAHAAVWTIPFPWRHKLQLIGVMAENAIQSGQTGVPLDITGKNRQFSAAYTVPLASAWSKVRHKVIIAADYKSSTSDILFGGQSLATSDAEVMQFRLGYDLTVTDKLGYTRFSVGGIYSPGNLLRRNTYEAFDQLRAASQADYWYAVADLERLLRLPKGFSLVLHVAGQHSSDRLLPTEQMLAGGYRTVRGFRESIARGDSGVRGSVEFYLPPMHLLNDDTLNCYAFYDAAYLTSVGDFDSEPDQNLQSAGVGLRYSVSDHLDLRLAYGWPLRQSGVSSGPPGRLHFGMNMKY